MRKKALLIPIVLGTAALTGCGGSKIVSTNETNLLGIVRYEKAVYTPTGPATFSIASDEIDAREIFSGDKLSLFWGLITLKDY